jgi:tripartite-type tricarboxylate transporter receptor subunit TctC
MTYIFLNSRKLISWRGILMIGSTFNPPFFGMSRFLICLLILFGIHLPLSAQTNFPSKPLRLVVPFPPGGSTDILARVMAQKLSDILEQPVLVDNKAGASGAIAADFVAKSSPDGYTLIFATASTQVINPAFSKVSFDPVQDFTPVGMIGTSSLGLIVNSEVPGSGVQDLVVWLRANPGKANFASFGNMTVSHLAGELFMQSTNTRMVHVPYKGAPAAMTDLIAGRVSVYFDALTNAIQTSKTGRAKLIAVTSLQRNASIPNVLTVAEQGVPGFEAVTWYGILGPAKMPPDVVTKLNAAINKTLADNEVREKLVFMGVDSIPAGPDALGIVVRRDLAKWIKLSQEVKIKTD